MRVPFGWIRDFLEINMTPQEAAGRLTMLGLEVEGVEKAGDDFVFEVNVTPNRPDCLSVIGIARELSADARLPMKFPEHGIKEEHPTGFSIEIDDSDLCRRYAGRVISGARVGPSPKQMQRRLENSGIRPKNNIVDITNYVLLELGHPLHAFDLDKLRGGMIRVRKAGKNTKLRTLDSIERTPPEEALLIWDSERPVAVAGVMGGEDTEVTESTVNVFIESAWFLPASVRRTSKALSLSTEASYRFERGTDVEMLKTALDRASHLIEELAGGKVQRAVDAYPGKAALPEVAVSTEKINSILGTSLQTEEIIAILKRLNIEVTEKGGALSAVPPPYRLDVRTPFDIMEEVARLHGYGRIPSSLPRAEIKARPASTKRAVFGRTMEAMRKSGFSEAVNFSFMNSESLDVLGLPQDDRRRRAVEILNPLRKEESLLRTMLLPSLMENLRHNVSRGVKDVRLFEVSKVFFREDSGLPEERWALGGIRFVEKSPSLWKTPSEDFYVVKGAAEALFCELKIKDYSFVSSEESFMHPGKSADVLVFGLRAGFLGVLSPECVEGADLRVSGDVVVFELDLEALVSSFAPSASFKPYPRFPSIERDVAVVVDERMRASDIMGLIKSYPSAFIEGASVFDSYKGSGIPARKKSLAFNVVYRSAERTLTEEEVEELHGKLVGHLLKETGGKLRGM